MVKPALPIHVAVEGVTDEPIVARLLRDLGFEPTVYVAGGKGKLDKRIGAYNQSARHANWLVVRDLDHDERCAGQLRAKLLPRPAPRMRFRIAVRATEAWLLADTDGVASFLRVRRGLIPDQPEALASPKDALIQLARQSSSTRIRDDFVPEISTTARVGPGYLSQIVEFASNHWNWKQAQQGSESLRRCVTSLESLARTSN